MKKDITKKFINEKNSKPPPKNYETNRTMVKSFDDTWSSDLIDLKGYGQKTIKVIDIY